MQKHTAVHHNCPALHREHKSALALHCAHISEKEECRHQSRASVRRQEKGQPPPSCINDAMIPPPRSSNLHIRRRCTAQVTWSTPVTGPRSGAAPREGRRSAAQPPPAESALVAFPHPSSPPAPPVQLLLWTHLHFWCPLLNEEGL